MQSFDWGNVLILPPRSEKMGHQVLHFSSADKPYQNSEKAKAFVETYLTNALPCNSDAEVLRLASDQVTHKEGLYIELGVCTGKTINFIGALNPSKTIYGFDSFEGLPEAWEREDLVLKAGTFAFKDKDVLPPVLPNVSLIKGWFTESLPLFVAQQTQGRPIAFLHIDCDLYTSTRTAFEAFSSLLLPGTVIVFDELYNYPGYEKHEFLALTQFLEASGLQAEFLAYNIHHEQVALRLVAT